MFEKFTADAREAVVAAQQEAHALGATRIRTVHVFLGVIVHAGPGLRSALEDEGYTAASVRSTVTDAVALGEKDAEALGSIGIDLGAVRASLEATFGEGALDRPAPEKRGWLNRKTGHIPFDAGAKKALELSLREAIARKDSEIRCEHLLLGLIRGADASFTAVVDEPSTLRARIESLVS
ncbi:Clp protease N-terminal domain-containing protein [Rhodococcus sp. P1Y]|uniref:Clp protease N-terminal domain-containing protein n=1 Tax=Rhodococcus sp. P1Y TaxID=1302308 RepID=UPI000EB13F7F|nr:Clp protease N-terminal domain-containing protein [Rhodococcus sp. P1Y]AYJ51019.1 Clp protease [Rhodococcus sp. P1Y]